jgi:OFA family oxalate/formate antiporter-like MFS transporter
MTITSPRAASDPGELRSRWFLVVSAALGVGCSSIVLPYYTIGVLTKPLTAEFGWSRAEVQLAILFSSGLGVVTAPLVGWLIDRYGPRALALPCMIGLSLGFFLAATMNGELWMYYLAYCTMALLGAGTTPITWTRAIATSFDRQRGFALGLMLSGTGVCAILVPPFTTWLLESYGWRVAYFGLGLLPLLVAGPLVLLGFHPDRHRSAPVGSALAEQAFGLTFAEAVRDYRFWVLAGSILAIYLALSGIGTNLIPALTDGGLSPARAATIASLFGVAVIVGRLIVGFLVDRYWAPGVAAVALGLPVIGCLILMEPASPARSAVAVLLLGVAAGAELDLMSFLATKYFGVKHYAKIYAVLYAMLAVAGGTAPMLFARLFDLTQSYETAFVIAAGFFAFGAAILLTLGRYPKLGPT